jgi:hypothetical protein
MSAVKLPGEAKQNYLPPESGQRIDAGTGHSNFLFYIRDPHSQDLDTRELLILRSAAIDSNTANSAWNLLQIATRLTTSDLLGKARLRNMTVALRSEWLWSSDLHIWLNSVTGRFGQHNYQIENLFSAIIASFTICKFLTIGFFAFCDKFHSLPL